MHLILVVKTYVYTVISYLVQDHRTSVIYRHVRPGIPTYRHFSSCSLLMSKLDDFHLVRLASLYHDRVYSVSRSSLRSVSITIVRVTLRCESIVIGAKMVHPDLPMSSIPTIIRSRMRRCGPVRRPRAGVVWDSVGHSVLRMRVRV